MGKKYSIAVDFDGVIHEYTTKWSGKCIISDGPMPGALEWLTEMVKKFDVYIYSARLTVHEDEGETMLDVENAKIAMMLWFRMHGLSRYVATQLKFWTNPGKPTALVYIDDRGYRFEGEFPTREDIFDLRPWKYTPEEGYEED